MWLTQSEEEKRKKVKPKGNQKIQRERDVSTKHSVNVTPYTHSTKRHGFHTRERFSKNVGEKRQEVGLLSVLEEREEPVKVGVPTHHTNLTLHPQNTDH